MLINQVSVAYPGCKRHGSFDWKVGGALGKRFVYVCLPTSAKGSRRMALNGSRLLGIKKPLAFRPVGGKYPSLCSRGGSTCLLMSVKFEDGGPEGWFFLGGCWLQRGWRLKCPSRCCKLFLYVSFGSIHFDVHSHVFIYFPLFSFLSSYILNRGGTNYAYGMALGQPA